MRVQVEISELDKQRGVNRDDFEEQRRVMHADAEELERKKASLTGMIETARRHCVQLDAANSRLEEDRQSLLEQEKTLRNDIRESDQALADAVAGNERYTNILFFVFFVLVSEVSSRCRTSRKRL